MIIKHHTELLSQRVVNSWNSIPTDIKESHNPSILKTRYNRWKLDITDSIRKKTLSLSSTIVPNIPLPEVLRLDSTSNTSSLHRVTC